MSHRKHVDVEKTLCTYEEWRVAHTEIEKAVLEFTKRLGLLRLFGVCASSFCLTLGAAYHISSISFKHSTVGMISNALGLPDGSLDGFHSQFGQDRWVAEYLDQRGAGLNGIFVEFGINDGLKNSNTAYFEKRRGFTGLCAEPTRRNFELATENRPRCQVVHAAVGECEGTETVSLVEFKTGVENYSGINSGLNGVVDHYGDKEWGAQQMQIKCRELGCDVVTVPCRRLQALLDAANISRVDYMSVDTEGSEITALKSMDWEKMGGGPTVLQVEVQRVLLSDATVSIGQKETTLMEFMTSKGYRKAAELASMFKPKLKAGQKALLTLDLMFVRPEENEPTSYLSL